MFFKKNKYRNIKTNGYDSKKEAKRGAELLLLQKAYLIRDLQEQPEFLLQEAFKYNGKTERAIYYIADFMYFDIKKNKFVIEDVKSPATAKDKTYRIKKKLFLKKWIIGKEDQYEFLEII